MSISSDHNNSASDSQPIPREFLKRRLHSLTGIFLILFLIEHMLTNSQAALWLGDEGKGFVDAVNFLHSLPYLQVIEIALLLVPFVIHGIWGLLYLRETKFNSFSSDGSTPSLPYPRNIAFTWQRVTAIILAIGLVWHVISMRFLRYPEEIGRGINKTYAVIASPDNGIAAVAARLDAEVITEETKLLAIDHLQKEKQSYKEALESLKGASLSSGYERLKYEASVITEKELFVEELKPSKDKWYVLSDNFGTAVLFTVRDAFKSYVTCIFYTLFVLAACFHAGNGLWTAAISWGLSVNERSRVFIRWVSYGLMALLSIWGLASIWLTYFVTLRQ